MKQTIQQAVASVQNAIGSMYTREDVISLLNRLEAPAGPGIQITDEVIKKLVNVISDQVRDNAQNLDSGDVCDLSSAEFSLNYNELSLDSVDIDTDSIADSVVSGIYDTIEEFFEDLQAEEESDTLEVPES